MSVLQSKRRAVINEPHKATSSGAIVQMDNAEYAPMGVVANFTPVQDLHGQTSPYPAGGGINIFDADNLEDISVLAGSGLLATYGHSYIKAGTYALNAYGSGSSNYLYARTKNSDDTWETYYTVVATTVVYPLVITIAEGQTLYVYDASPGSSKASSVTKFNNWKFQVAYSSTQPAEWHPYSNICPISGWTGCNVTRTGKNLLKLDKSEMISSSWLRSFPLKLKAGTYTMSCQEHLTIGSSWVGCEISIRTENSTLIKMIHNAYTYGSSLMKFTFTLTEEEASKMGTIMFQPTANGATFELLNAMKNMIEVGSTATEFEPYNGNTYNVSWQTEAGTVYGGSLDVASGVLTAKYGYVDLGSATWNKNANGQFYSTLVAQCKDSWLTTHICSVYETSSRGAYDQNIDKSVSLSKTAIWVRDLDYTTATAFKTSVTGQYLAYELATPIINTLTPTQIKSLRGKNNVWTDMNAPTDVSAWVH